MALFNKNAEAVCENQAQLVLQYPPIAVIIFCMTFSAPHIVRESFFQRWFADICLWTAS